MIASIFLVMMVVEGWWVLNLFYKVELLKLENESLQYQLDKLLKEKYQSKTQEKQQLND
jgi:hypothetical protein